MVKRVKFQVIKKAAECYNSGEVLFLSASEKAARFMVSDVLVRMEITEQGTRFQCECEHHKNKQLQDKLCGRVIAVIMYCYFRKGYFRC